MPVVGIHSCKGTNFNGYPNFNGIVELLKWISGLLSSARVVLNALVYNPLVDKGSHWAVFISTDVCVCEHEGPLYVGVGELTNLEIEGRCPENHDA